MEQVKEIGYITNLFNYLVKIEGLPTVKINEIVVTRGGKTGVIIAIEKEFAYALMLQIENLKAGEEIEKTGKSFSVSVGPFLMGRIVNTLGLPIDGKANFPPSSTVTEIFRDAPGIPKRERISEQFYTGVSIVDLLVPIGKGQRELILGDAKSGKTFFLLQTIVSQKLRDVVCIYAGIGKSEIEIKEIYEFLENSGVIFKTIIVSASASESSSMIYYAPYTAMTIAEYFQNQGRDVLIILDDLTNHAKYTREISLLSQNLPGRESYPGDIFFTYSRLVERAGRFNQNNNNGSITALPVAETKYMDLTSFIPTTLMAMTDGHVYFSSELFYRGQRPAVDVSLSVSRVGNQCQTKLYRDLSGRLKETLATYRQVENLNRFGTELSEDTKRLLLIGSLAEEILRQEQGEVVDVEDQIFLNALIFTSFIDGKDRLFIRRNKKKLIFALGHDTELKGAVKELGQLDNFDEYLKKMVPLIPKINQICQEPQK